MIRNVSNKVIGSYDPKAAFTKAAIERTKLVNKLQLHGAQQETFAIGIILVKEEGVYVTGTYFMLGTGNLSTQIRQTERQAGDKLL